MPPRTPLYSRSRASRIAGGGSSPAEAGTGTAGAPTPAEDDAAPRRPSSYARVAAPAAPAAAAAAAPRRPSRLRAFAGRHERRLWALALVALAAAWLWTVRGAPPQRAPLTPDQITHLVREHLQEKPLPSPAAAAYAAIRGSVVRVVGLDGEGDPGKADESGESIPQNVGTGVVIVDNGTILTNLHVVQGARRLKVTFADGSESEAVLVGAQPENDLAVLRAKTVPDDLKAATMRSTADLAPGDEVVAVGFPFGIGPSASHGVVSGLKREFRSPDGQQMITNLIQFDAAANPGNSGGPLVTMDGAVVGIVTAILNPSKQRVFIGIGFAVPIENAASAAGMHPF